MAHAVDVLVLLLFVWGFFSGAARGFAWQVLGIAICVGSYVAAFPVALLFRSWIQRGGTAWVLAFVVIWGLSSLFAQRFRKRLQRSLDEEEWDWLLGGGLGLLKAWVFATALGLVLIASSNSARDTILASHSGRALRCTVETASFVLPDEVEERLRPLLPVEEDFGEDGEPSRDRPSPRPS